MLPWFFARYKIPVYTAGETGSEPDSYPLNEFRYFFESSFSFRKNGREKEFQKIGVDSSTFCGVSWLLAHNAGKG